MMNEESNIAQYRLSDIIPGLTKNFKIKVTESMTEEFAKLTGDYSPIHMEEEYARSTNFGRRICHGMLVGSFFSRLIGMYLPGKYGLLLSYSLRHLLPCFLNQEIIVEGKVMNKSSATRIITIRATVTDSFGKDLINGTLKVLMMK
jgi:3-hydroxybutyryl-CoA dehydratase